MSTNTEEKNWLAIIEAVYEGAEVGNCAEGDTIILPSGGEGYIVRTAVGWDSDAPEGWGIRILKRAPEPELQAVMAGYIADDCFNVDPAVRHVWTSRGGGYWESIVDFVRSDELVDPAPLVELPSHEELARAVYGGVIQRRLGTLGPRDHGEYEADAVLELLEGK